MYTIVMTELHEINGDKVWIEKKIDPITVSTVQQGAKLCLDMNAGASETESYHLKLN